MKDKKELNKLKSRLGDLDEKLAELNSAELEEVIGGFNPNRTKGPVGTYNKTTGRNREREEADRCHFEEPNGF